MPPRSPIRRYAKSVPVEARTIRVGVWKYVHMVEVLIRDSPSLMSTPVKDVYGSGLPIHGVSRSCPSRRGCWGRLSHFSRVSVVNPRHSLTRIHEARCRLGCGSALLVGNVAA